MVHLIRLWQKKVIFSSKFFFKQLPVSLEAVKIGVASKKTRKNTQQNFNSELIVQKLFVAKSLTTRYLSNLILSI
jgi:hypothetical protein